MMLVVAVDEKDDDDVDDGDSGLYCFINILRFTPQATTWHPRAWLSPT